jgi:secondary thiamine-phosphate synthase enzyme
MTVHTEQLELISEGSFFALNITQRIRTIVTQSGIRAGNVLVFYQHTTGAVIVVEHEAGILVDLEDVLERITPVASDYRHHMTGYDRNGAAHVRTALMGVSVTLPVLDGDLLLGQYQDVLVIDMDPNLKTRRVVVQVMGD